jgi:hypothetical protein
MLRAELPTLDEARRSVIAEIKRAKREGVKVLKVIHGYGSSGKGGALCVGLRKSFGLRKKEGVIKDFIAGENFFDFQSGGAGPVGSGADLRGDPDLGATNEGVTILWPASAVASNETPTAPKIGPENRPIIIIMFTLLSMVSQQIPKSSRRKTRSTRKSRVFMGMTDWRRKKDLPTTRREPAPVVNARFHCYRSDAHLNPMPHEPQPKWKRTWQKICVAGCRSLAGTSPSRLSNRSRGGDFVGSNLLGQISAIAPRSFSKVKGLFRILSTGFSESPSFFHTR